MGRDENVVFQEWREAEGDKKAELAAELHNLLWLYATKLCWMFLKDRNQDVVAASVYKAFAFSGDFRGEAKFTTWFYQVVFNACQSELRKKQRLREVSFDSLTAAELESLPTGVGADEALIVQETIGGLPEEEQEFLQAKIRGVPDAELAARFGLSAVGTRVRWHRLKKKLERKLRNGAGEQKG